MGTVVDADPGLTRTFPVQFSDSNVDLVEFVNMVLTNTNCGPGVFVPQYRTQITISGTGTFRPPTVPTTGTGSGTFQINGQPFQGQLTMNITANRFQVTQQLNGFCFVVYTGEMSIQR